MAAAWLAVEPALIQDDFANADRSMSYRGKSAVIQRPFHSLGASINPNSNEAALLQRVGWPSLSQMRTCQKTCDRDPMGLPAHGTRTDWSELILPESQRSGEAALRPAMEEAARISQAVWTSPLRSERSFHDRRGC
jgi:hypothetical protein